MTAWDQRCRTSEDCDDGKLCKEARCVDQKEVKEHVKNQIKMERLKHRQRVRRQRRFRRF